MPPLVEHVPSVEDMASKWLLTNLLYASAIVVVFLARRGLGQGGWPRSAVLDKDERFRIQWWLEADKHIVFKLEVRTQGYVSIGFSKDRTMRDCDMVVGWVSNGQRYLKDLHMNDYQKPVMDNIQDWELLSGEENCTHTTLVIRRKFDTCDPQDFALEYHNTVRLMYVYSLEDPPNEFSIDFQDAFSRGDRSFLLLQPDIPRDPDEKYWYLLNENFAVSPDWHTMYWCKMFKIPDSITEKHHITAVELSTSDEEHTEYIHHILLYECPGADPEEMEPLVGTPGFDCYTPNTPSAYKKCEGGTTGWAKGGEGQFLPGHIGLPLDRKLSTYYKMIVHYDNINRVRGVPGNAGLRLQYTPNLRQYDAGTLGIGRDYFAGPNVMIPPGIPNFVVAAHSTPDCINIALPPQGVLMTSVFLHTHLAGKRVQQRHFRDNIELSPLAKDDYYDFDYQQFRPLKEETLLLPSDQLTLECTYDTSNRTTTTFGGLSTREEMCLSYTFYYPRFEGVYSCGTQGKKENVVELIDSDELRSLTAGKPNYDKTFIDFMTNYDWKMTDIQRYEEGMRFFPMTTLCSFGNGSVSTVLKSAAYPENLQECEEAPNCMNANK